MDVANERLLNLELPKRLLRFEKRGLPQKPDVFAAGAFAVSNESGRYILRDLPAGRLGLLVGWPNRPENTLNARFARG